MYGPLPSHRYRNGWLQHQASIFLYLISAVSLPPLFSVGQTKPVTVYQLVAKDTVDEKVYTRAKNKKEKSDALLDGVVEESTKENDSKEISKIVQEELAKWMLTRKGGQGGNGGGGREGGGGCTTTGPQEIMDIVDEEED